MMTHTRYLAAISLLTITTATQADISFTQRITVDASGGMSLFASKGDVVTEISGDRARIENKFKMKSRLVAALAGNTATTDIIRLDKGLSWTLIPDEREYAEHSFDELRAQREEAMARMQDQNTQATLPITEEGCQWTEGDIEFERPRDKDKIAGIKTSLNIVRMHQTCHDPDTGNQCDMTWTMKSWMASRLPGSKEAIAFQEEWAEAMGMNEFRANLAGPANGLLGMFSANWDEVAEELEQMRGYPLKTVMQMSIGGEQCKTASGAAIAADELWADASTAAYNAALDETGNATGNAVGKAAGESLGEGVAGSIGGAAIGAATGELIGGLTGMFKKKKDRKPAQAPSEQKKVTVFTVTSEVTEWSDSQISNEQFDEPESWKKSQ